MADRRIDRRREKRPFVTIPCTGLACLLAAPSYAEGVAAAPRAEVVVRRAVRECFTSLVHASGYLVPRRSAVVMFAAPGYRITEVRAKVGDLVKRGDVVARASPDDTKGSPGSAAETAITSPASGLVLQSTSVVGLRSSQAPKPLFTIAVDAVIEAAVEVPSVHVLELKAGQPVRLMAGDGSVLDGRVRRVPAVIDPATQMGATRLAIEASGRLEPSRFIQTTIEARRSCGIGIPTAALRHTSAGTFAQVLEAGDVIASRAVAIGLSNATDSEVTSGLAEGDTVVAGTGASREGDHVKPVFADPEDRR